MDIFSYIGKVKAVKKNEILSAILNIKVAGDDLKAGLENLQSNDIDLSDQIEHWVITKSLKKAVTAQGFGGADLVGVSKHGLGAIDALTTELTKAVNSYKESLWDGHTMTVKQANLLNVIEYLNFWLRYTRMVYDVLLTMNNQKVDPTRYLNGVDLRWINGTASFYNNFTIDLLRGAATIMKNMNDLPDIEVTQTSLDVMESTGGKGKVDLLQKGFGIHLVNPLFWLGVGISKLQGVRIERMRRDNEYFAMKISQAINKRNGTNDPELDRRIEIYQDKIIRNDHTISEIEADYA
jgi:hypothetical protein